MDGFHLDNRLLDMRGLRARKGSHETFDVQGFISLIMRLKHDEDVIYPIFDRARDLAIAGAGNVSQSVDFVLVEGNYLLFDHPDWSALAELWDFSIWIETPLDVIRDRCIARWLAHDHTPEEARVRTESNDLANARRLLSSRLSADIDLADHSEHAEKHERHL